jgi:hypothetical protein
MKAAEVGCNIGLLCGFDYNVGSEAEGYATAGALLPGQKVEIVYV